MCAADRGPALHPRVDHGPDARRHDRAQPHRRAHDLTSLWPSGDPNDNRSTIVTPDTAPVAPRTPGGYGQTEVVGLATFLGLGAPSAGRAGRPSPAVSIRVVDEDGRDVAEGDVGEIVVRGPAVMNGYWRRDALNEARRASGWHRTNDLGRREADGSLSFVGPRVAMIKSAAENIYPAEVESCLIASPGGARGVRDRRPRPDVDPARARRRRARRRGDGDGRRADRALPPTPGVVQEAARRRVRRRVADARRPGSWTGAPSTPASGVAVIQGVRETAAAARSAPII